MKTHVIAVNYLNTTPFIHGLKNAGVLRGMQLELAMPSVCAQRLISGEKDAGLMPVGALKELNSYSLVSNLCVGADGAVDTVKLYSHSPIERIQKVYLDYQSRTSVELLKLLMQKHWKKNDIYFNNTQSGFEKAHLQDHESFLLIGDRNFNIDAAYEYVYDLSEEWLRYTGLPFVFAVWVGKPELNQLFAQELDTALHFGISQMDTVIELNAAKYPGVDIRNYLTKKISYSLDQRKWEGLRMFLSQTGDLNSLKILDQYKG